MFEGLGTELVARHGSVMIKDFIEDWIAYGERRTRAAMPCTVPALVVRARAPATRVPTSIASFVGHLR